MKAGMAHSRLSRDLFHALTYEREMTRAGVEVFYALTAGDQTSPEGRLIRHMFQALDQFEVEKLRTLSAEVSNDDQRTRIAKQVGEVDQRIERQLAAIEAGVDPVLVGERIRNLKAEREEAQAALAQLEASYRDSTAVDPADALAVLDALRDLGKSLIAADPDIGGRCSTPSGSGSRSTATMVRYA